MKSSIQTKLQTMVERYEEIAALLSDPDVIGQQSKFRELSKEYAQLEPLVKTYHHYEQLMQDMETSEQLLQEDDADMREMARQEIAESKDKLQALEEQLHVLLLPQDPNDNRNIFLEIRAGTGGDEAAIFVGDLFRMYNRYAEKMGWRTEVVSQSHGEHGGFKEIIARITGQGVYSKLKFESGAHRVQRVPVTESQGRVHTSACTVAIMPEVEAIDEIDINPSDLKVDTYRASGAGGQHVNTTDSAIRITHLPSGIVVECQDERSQHKNRAKAMTLLQAKILAHEQAVQQQEQAQTRKSLVGSGDRSERIRTYNYPQGRVTEHRINLTLYKLSDIMEGELAQVVDPLIREHQAEQMASLSDDSE